LFNDIGVLFISLRMVTYALRYYLKCSYKLAKASMVVGSSRNKFNLLVQ